MSRKCNTDCQNKSFKKSLIDQVWNKRVPHVWGLEWGLDKYGNLIKYSEYGKVSQKYGWDIDHSNPISNKGTDHINNLQPLQSYYNRYIKSDHYPWTQNHHALMFKGFPRTLK